MQGACQLEVVGESFLGDFEGFCADERASPAAACYARALLSQAWAAWADIDRRIGEVAEHWEVRRLLAVDRNVLRVAISELLHHAETPPRVVINEAVEIGREFGTAESGAFINGVLDAVARRAGLIEPRPEDGAAGGSCDSPARAEGSREGSHGVV